MAYATATVRKADIKELAQLTATLADAFVDDPILRWLIPNRFGRNGRLRRLFELELMHYVFPAGCVWTTDDGRGASLELAPEAWQMPSSLPLSAAIGWVRVFGMRLREAGRTQAFFEEHHLREPHLYVRYVGVASGFQGRGLGSALLRPTLRRADAQRLATYLEASTESSARLYERLGFQHLGELRIPGGPLIWPMRRPMAAS